MICATKGCGKTAHVRRMCHTCYRRWHRNDGEPRVAVDPELRLAIDRRRKAHENGLSGLARDLAFRFGSNPASEYRLLLRILQGSPTIYGKTQDKLSTFLWMRC